VSGDPYTDRYVPLRLRGMQETRRFDAAPDIFGGVKTTFQFRPWQQNAEFVSATPENKVRDSDGLAQNACHRNQSFVSGKMSMKVIDPLEIINVNQHQRHRKLVTLGSCHFSDNHFVEESRIVQSC
jgi:hypothetical protein